MGVLLNRDLVANDTEKAKVFNAYFTSVFIGKTGQRGSLEQGILLLSEEGSD